jgi:hypothetical protein
MNWNTHSRSLNLADDRGTLFLSFDRKSERRFREPFSSWLCLADLQYVDGLGELAGAPGAMALL